VQPPKQTPQIALCSAGFLESLRPRTEEHNR
jgi:hypothetical protein